MKKETIVMCVVALLLGMLLANMLKNVCGCKTVEGNTTESISTTTTTTTTTEANTCNTNSCINGKCINLFGGSDARCICDEGWSGDNCDTVSSSTSTTMSDTATGSSYITDFNQLTTQGTDLFGNECMSPIDLASGGTEFACHNKRDCDSNCYTMCSNRFRIPGKGMTVASQYPKSCINDEQHNFLMENNYYDTN